MPNFFRSDPKYLPEIPTIIEEIEEFPPLEEADKTEEILKEGDNIFIGLSQKDKEWFRCFVDGTYRIARTATYGGVPIYLSSITAVLTERTPEKKLREVGLKKQFTVVLFPFDAFSETFRNSREGSKIKEFRDYLKEEYKAIPDTEFRQRDALSVIQSLDSANIWIFSDITYKGLKKPQEDIKSDNIMDEGKIYSRVKARVRVLMSILETANLKFFREKLENNAYREGKEDWVLIDGTLNNYRKFFCADTNQSEYFPMFNKVVGFIKTIRRQPNIDMLNIYRLQEREFIVSIAGNSDLEKAIMEETQENELIGENEWGFIYLRFRKPFGYPLEFLTSRGIVKLQFRVDEGVKGNVPKIKEKALKIVNLAVKEKFPLPSDKSRIWKEAVAIEETEKIAKSRLSSKEWLRNRGWTL